MRRCSALAQRLSASFAPKPVVEKYGIMDTYFGNKGYTRYDAALADFHENDLSTV